MWKKAFVVEFACGNKNNRFSEFEKDLESGERRQKGNVDFN